MRQVYLDTAQHWFDKRSSLVYFMGMRIETKTSGNMTDTQFDAPTLRRYHQLEVLDRVASAVNGSQDLDTVLNIALDNALEIVNSATGGILLIDKDSGTLYYRACRGFQAANTSEVRMPL